MVAIIGGGASGLISSIFASKNNEVTLLEKNNNCGKKLLITGNGKCNYFNDDFNINNYHSNNIDILKNIITDDNKNSILNFFDSIGIVPKIKEGYYYPFSNQAATILYALTLEAKLNGVEIITNAEVLDVVKEDKFIIKTNERNYYADKVIIATGSKAAPNTGSNGLGYDLLKNMGHTIIDVNKALVQLVAEEPFLKEWAGIRTDVEVTLYEDNKIKAQEKGEIQLTNYGISGICVFQLSRDVAIGLKNKLDETISINFLPYIKDNIKDYINKRNNEMKDRTIIELLEGMLNYKIVNIILKKLNIKQESWNELNDTLKDNIINELTNFKLKIINTKDFDNAQVCSGGIPLTQIDINTMESKIVKGLYITGELLDVDGKCGGFNLGFAWTTGMIAGKNI